MRGAYHPCEVARAHASGADVPVWSVKEDTDKCYNECVKILLKELASNPGKGWSLGILFGTHNWESCNLILNEMVHLGLVVKEKEGEKVGIGEDVLEKVAVGQLYGPSFSRFRWYFDMDWISGMSDALTNSIVERVNSPSPFVIKYVLCIFITHTSQTNFTNFCRYVPYGALQDVSLDHPAV